MIMMLFAMIVSGDDVGLLCLLTVVNAVDVCGVGGYGEMSKSCVLLVFL